MDENILRKYKEAGKILAASLSHGRELIRPGASVLEICNAVESQIQDRGGGIAFPAQLSIDDVAAHACPQADSDIVLEKGNLVKLDIGVHVDGYIADSAVTVDLGDHAKLTTAAEEALQAALDTVAPGVTLQAVGKAIQDVIEGYGLQPIRNLSGHGLDRFQVHTEPNVPNHAAGGGTTLEEDQVIAIEPFASDGAGIIYEQEHASVYMLDEAKPVRNRMARKLLSDIEDRNGLPFTPRWLQREHGHATVKVGMRELLEKEIIEDYPPLADEEKGMVAQAEHTVIVRDDPIVTTERSN